MCSLSRIFACLVVLFCLAPLSWAKYVAVLETVADPSLKEAVSQSDRIYMTDVLRSAAVKILPAQQNYTIMTRENINMMLPPGKTIEECEGSCLAETGKNIAADYVAQARIGNFGGLLTLSVELYETSSGKLMASFNGQGENVRNLLEVIQKESANFFKSIKGGFEGFGDFSSGEAFSFQGSKKFIVEIVSDPVGAVPTVDGKAFSKCLNTPCKVQLEAGEHRFVASKDLYDDAESVVKVEGNNQQISLKLAPNFGYLDIRPQMANNLESVGDLRVLIDSSSVAPGRYILTPGLHSVLIEHPCYDPMSFKVSIAKGKTETFEKNLTRGVGALELDADYRGEPQAVPVQIDGVDAGSTPFSGEVPMCAKVTVGEPMHEEIVNVALKYHEVVKYTHHLYNAPAPVTISQDISWTADSIDMARKAAQTAPEEKHVHWIPIAISSVAIVGGISFAVIENYIAKGTREKGMDSPAQYKERRKRIHRAQQLRALGVGIAIAGGVGLGLSFVF